MSIFVPYCQGSCDQRAAARLAASALAERHVDGERCRAGNLDWIPQSIAIIASPQTAVHAVPTAALRGTAPRAESANPRPTVPLQPGPGETAAGRSLSA